MIPRLRLIRSYSFSEKLNSNVLTLLHYNALQLNIRTHHSSSKLVFNAKVEQKLGKISLKNNSFEVVVDVNSSWVSHSKIYTAKATFRSHGSSLLLRLPVEPYRG